MFRNRTFKVLGNLILMVFFCTGQVTAAPNNNANQVNSFSSNSARSTLPLIPELSQQAIMMADETMRVSVNSSGAEGNGHSQTPSMSSDGRYVVFQSDSNNLVSGDTNGISDVFLHDVLTNTTTRVSVASDGTQGDGSSGGSLTSAFSADGRYVVFSSFATNLVSGDTNGRADIFVRDLQANTTTRVSVASDGTQANNDSFHPAISANGRYIAFGTGADNLVSGDLYGVFDIFVRDLQANTTARISVASDGTQGNASSDGASFTADGRYVAFQSLSSNLVGDDTNGLMDVFIHDILSNTTTRVSIASDGAQANGHSYDYRISADGRYVAFQSIGTNLVNGDTNGEYDIFVRDLQSNNTTRVSVASDGTQANSRSGQPSISANGRYVAFWSFANNLVSGDTNGNVDGFIYDMQTKDTKRLSVSSLGIQGNGDSYPYPSPRMDATWRFILMPAI